jgi:sec-independent protein translocase protein TatA
MNLGVTELLIILGIVLLVFGSTRLPKLARSLGEASKEFKKGTEEPQTNPQKTDGEAKTAE